jgi:hypothetical protein
LQTARPPFYVCPQQKSSKYWAVMTNTLFLIIRICRSKLGENSHWLDFVEIVIKTDRPDLGMIEDYVRWKFGSVHHLTSLLRFVRAIEAARESGSSQIEPRDFTITLPYQLNPRVHVLADLHDCAALLKRIDCEPAGSRLLDESEVGERGVYLVQVSVDKSICYCIDPGVEAILGLFEQPRTCREVADLLCKATGLPELGTEFFGELVQSEILIPAPFRGDQIGEAMHLATAEA